MNSGFGLRTVFLCAVLMAVPVVAAAQQAENVMYVNDILHIAVREAPNEQAAIVDVVPSGTRMTILEPAEEGASFVHVRLDSGEEGWALIRFLTDEPIARQRLETAEARIKRLEDENRRLTNDLAEVRKARDELKGQAAELQRQTEELTAELERIKAISAEAVALDQENRRLTAELETARKGRREAEEEAEAAQTELYTIAGIAAVLGLGVGFYIGYTPVRREKKWRQLP